MNTWEVVFNVPAQVVVKVKAEDDAGAADEAWLLAQEHLRTVEVPNAHGVRVLADLDGIGADEVTEEQS